MTGFGVDIAFRRADDLDKLMIDYAVSQSGVSVLELGSGAGGQSVRLAKAGASVLAVDIHDYKKRYESLVADHNLDEARLRFVQGDMTQLAIGIKEQSFDLCCLQRVLHYVPYKLARQLLELLRAVVHDKLYVSVTGVETAIGEYYPAAKQPIDCRFAQLSEFGRETFSISEPVCLYRESEFLTLLKESGWEVERCWTSAFGNHKAVCK